MVSSQRRAVTTGHYQPLLPCSSPMAVTALSSLPSATLAGGHRQPWPRARVSPISAPPSTRSNRFAELGNTRYAIDLHLKRRAVSVFLSNVNPSNGDSSKIETDSTSSTGGPPVLTILAGVLVFLLVCWVVGSIVTRLISLIVNVPSSQ